MEFYGPPVHPRMCSWSFQTKRGKVSGESNGKLRHYLKKIGTLHPGYRTIRNSYGLLYPEEQNQKRKSHKTELFKLSNILLLIWYNYYELISPFKTHLLIIYLRKMYNPTEFFFFFDY